MNRALSLYIVLLALLTACAGPIATSQYQNDSSAIGICGGGIDDGVKASIEAEYVKVKGSVDASFSRYVKTVFNANDVSEDKYNKYIECVLEIDKRQRADSARSKDMQFCKDKCQSLNSSCGSRSKSLFNTCITEQINGCLKDCRRRGFSYDACQTKLCAWTELPERAKEFYSNRCERNKDYIEQNDKCSNDFESCLKACTPSQASKQ